MGLIPGLGGNGADIGVGGGSFLGSLNGALPGGGSGTANLLQGLPIVGGFFGQPGSATPGAIPQGWMNTAGLQQPGTGTYPVQPQAAPAGLSFTGDLSKPGAAEDFFAANQGKFGMPGNKNIGDYWQQNQSKFAAPGQGEQYWNKVAGNFNSPQRVAQNAQGAYTQFQQSTPQSTAPFYDRAVQQATNALNRQAAATGQLGSSFANGQVADAAANLYGQQALNDANYGLQRAQTAGQLSQGADTSSRGASQDFLSWLTNGGQLSNQVDSNTLARLMGGGALAGNVDQGGQSGLLNGMQAANLAQSAEQARAQQYFNNTMGLGSAQAQAEMGMYLPMIQADLGMLDASQQAALGYPKEGLAQSVNGRASSEQGIGNFMGLGGKFFGGMMGM